MSAKQIPDAHPTPVEPVRLPPVFGISPLTYLPIGLLTLVMLAIAGVLVLPGLLRYGSLVTFSSVPHSAAIYIDGKYHGSTPSEIFLPAGSYDVQLETPHHETAQQKIQVDGRRFASLLLPRRQQVGISLTLNQPEELARETVQEYAAWAIAGGESQRYRIPAVLTPAVHRLLLDQQQSHAETVLAHSIDNTATVAAARDLLAASLLLEARIPSSAGAIGVLRRIARIEQNSEAALLWFEQILPEPLQQQLAGTPYFMDRSEQIATGLITATAPHGFGPEGLETLPAADPESITIPVAGEQLRFVYVPSTEYLHGISTGSHDSRYFPRQEQVNGFYLLSSPVTRAQYAAVMGMGTDQLPAAPGGSTDPRIPMTGVSWDDTRQFIAALSPRLPSAYQTWSVQLPDSVQWEAAARWNGDPLPNAVLRHAQRSGPETVGQETGNIGLSDMTGNVWEWTRSWYRAAAGYQLDAGYTQAAGQDWPLAERIVRGASWATSPAQSDVEQIGMQPEHWKTDYLGFRIVLEPPQDTTTP
ncbi:SUMF1/EgtB/PvdO family nonheme iron enzyme [Spirochaeta africana]|uniref:PEGA domain-containing protein n=1 Tax=Spirochaeta africana (strain ATCC 700263 / DSM 8902 / Z-7692) TaxID=889378 RepID=H9UJC3_SPIAZ|nr:SUMF1/EgtB/PvdO family nonheme iron enzyme [Spirochaeta africana]AFG37616.1 hypothetical protein Spiaf_1557 [Spirochaeta africana DSM 8902]